MKAITFHQHGPPSVLTYEEIPMPSLDAGEVLVRVKACALNHLDLWIRQGIRAYTIPLPHIPGSDVSGIVHQVGAGVTHVSVGDPVVLSPGLSCWNCEWCLAGQDNLCPQFKVLGAQVDGGYAEFVKVPAVNILPMPPQCSFEQAAAFPLVSVTAWHMVMSLAQLQPGETVLIMGAGSGVGSMAIQIANLVGARVISTIGTEEKRQKAMALGCDRVLNHTQEDIVKQVREATNHRGADVVIEHIGKQVWDTCIHSLARGGRLITCGATTGGESQLDLRFLFSRQLTIKGAYMGTRAELGKAAALVASGKLVPVVDRVFPLIDARKAQEYLLNRQAFGKVVLTI